MASDTPINGHYRVRTRDAGDLPIIIVQEESVFTKNTLFPVAFGTVSESVTGIAHFGVF